MDISAWGFLSLYLLTLLVLAWPLGLWIACISAGNLPTWMHAVEAPLYRLAGTTSAESMKWTQYSFALLAFNALGVLLVYAIQRLQVWLPLNPMNMASVGADSAFNTAISFVTNTNWQGYSGEATMSYLTQMVALSVQNFFSAATGIAVVFALIRGFAARSSSVIGNFWVDLTRITAWLLLPLSLVFALILVSQGVIQNFDAYKDVSTLEVTAFQQPKVGSDGQPVVDAKGAPVLEDAKTDKQTLPMGPVTMPPNGINESCIALTAPQLAAVVITANRLLALMPKRASLAWSNPGAQEGPLLRKALLQGRFDAILEAATHDGVPFVRRQMQQLRESGDLSADLNAKLERLLKSIERGFADADSDMTISRTT